MRYFIVDAFTDRPFGGNPAGVVLLGDAPFPSEELMLQVAAELRYSETAFVRRLSAAEYHVRYFTPAAEVELCGHATVATFALLHRLGMADWRCLCHTLAGDLAVEAGERVMMQMARPRIVETIADTEEIYKALGLNFSIVNSRLSILDLPVQVAYAGLNDIMVPLPDVSTLNALQPDMEAVAAITKEHETTSFHVFAIAKDGYTAHVRDFGPLYGIPEESATGTANAALTHYLAVNGVIPQQGDFAFLQGEAMGRPSVVATRIAPDGTVYVGGTAAVVAEGELLTQSASIEALSTAE
jgi:PhzF family phenazine biosynthesis protein